MRAKLYDLNRERESIVETVVERVLARHLEAAWASQEHGLEVLITEAAYCELSLLEGTQSKRDKAEYDFWLDIAMTASRNGEDANADLLVKLVQRYASRIVGRCNPTIHGLIGRAAPFALNTLFNLAQFGVLRRQPARWDERIQVAGEIERIRRLSRVGTLVYATTQVSQLDPLMLGWALEQKGLPPTVFGAAQDLYGSQLPAILMRHLGSYQFNARLKYGLYRDVLRTTNQLLLERGFHSMICPAGHRSRDGQLESRLEIELLKPIMGAYVRGLLEDEPHKIFVVPVTINYHLVLEAETLVAHALRKDSQGRQVIASDEFNHSARLASYATKVLSMKNSVAVTFAAPLDPFGNRVDDLGRSMDQKGRLIDPQKYVEQEGRPNEDETRDKVYTTALARRMTRSFRQNLVLSCVPLVSLTVLELVRARHARWDERRTIQFGSGEFLSRDELVESLSKLLLQARTEAQQGRVRLADCVATGEADQVLDEAYEYFKKYHRRSLLRRRGNGFELRNTDLLYYYGNRARGYGFEKRLWRSEDANQS